MINSLSCPQKEKNKGQHTMTLHPYKVIKPSDLPLPHTTPQSFQILYLAYNSRKKEKKS